MNRTRKYMSAGCVNRRKFCATSAGAFVSLALTSACRGSRSKASNGRLNARPRNTNQSVPKVGEAIKLGLDRDRDAILYVPKSAKSTVPLLMFLHGATQSADDMAWYLDSAPDETGIAILAPNSRATSWDAIGGGFGVDVDFLNLALERVFATVPVDPERVVIGGFSDGATYAIALGLINGDLFKRVLACSPGFVIDVAAQGKPRFFISHGTRDQILPIDRCGREVAADLKARGYEVTFREFNGRHEIPGEVMREGLRWVTG